MMYKVRHQTVYQTKEGLSMKREFVIALAAMLLSVSTVSWAAEDGAALYKKKCAGCHGASGEGKPAIKAPAIKGTTLDQSQLTQHITKGEAASKAPHNKGISGLTEEQATAIAEYIKTLK
jgi:cytochrome c6